MPSHYYKIFIREDGNAVHLIAFILENVNTANGTSWTDVKPIAIEAITTLEAIEQRAEVQFHPDVDRTNLVQSQDGSDWGMDTAGSNAESTCPK